MRTFSLDADERHHNPMGTLHGGVLCDIADVAMGLAYGSTLEEGETFTTLELKINFLRPVRSARLVADGLVVQRGKIGRSGGMLGDRRAWTADREGDKHMPDAARRSGARTVTCATAKCTSRRRSMR